MESINKSVEIKFVPDREIETIIIPIQKKLSVTTPGKRRENLRRYSVALRNTPKVEDHDTNVRQTPSRSCKSKKVYQEPESEVVLPYEEEIDGCNVETNVAKPTEALLEAGDSLGQEMFGFQTPRRRNTLSQIVHESMKPISCRTPDNKTYQSKVKISDALYLETELTRTPQRRILNKNNGTPKQITRTPSRRGFATPVLSNSSPKTPSHCSNQILNNAKTPYNLRKKIGKKISQMIDYETDSDISRSDSEFCPSDDETDSSEHSEIAENVSDDDTRSKRLLPRKAGVKAMGPVKQLHYALEPEDYFTTHTGGKQHTSDRTLTSRLAQDTLQQLLDEIPEKHSTAVSNLHCQHTSLFPQWYLVLREGFNILLYGVGSKRKILQSFQKSYLNDSDVLVINGFFPSLSLNEVVMSIAKDILELRSVPADIYDCLDLIESWYCETTESPLYLIVHNLDGEMLRNEKSQEILSRLASCKAVHMLASVDHINVPLLWDQTKLSLYNFTWWDVTNFQPYSSETSFESSVMVKQSGKLALSSLNNVFKALTTNARSIFLLIAQYHFDNGKNKNFTGMLFRDLYQSCREALLVSSDLALRSQLTDFLDHRLLKSRRGIDGAEYLTIPVESSVLQQFVKQHQQEEL